MHTPNSDTPAKRRSHSGNGNQWGLDSSLPPAIPGLLVERMIGEGGFGQVWAATQEQSGDRVAVKVLHLELVRSVDAMTRFSRELDAIQRLQHPSVVRALDHGTLSDGRPYLVLELLEGPSLREVLQDRGALPPQEVVTILEPLCDALGVAHAAGLVHRDVKASNVILAKQAEGMRPVLLDFGLVKLVDQVGPGLTSSRSMLGTPAAMAPEQMRGLPVDARTDVYALGLLAFHMLTGQPAFGGAPGVVQSYLQVHGARPRPSSKVDIDPAIDEPIARALAPDPNDRFSSTQELIEALRAVVVPDTDGTEREVVAVYVEGSLEDVEAAAAVLTTAGFLIALAAPDSVLAVAPRDRVVVEKIRQGLLPYAKRSRIGIGVSHATIQNHLVDGPALDVEGWAPPLQEGELWVNDVLLTL